MAYISTGFTTRGHGFRFVNAFAFSFEFELPLVGTIDLGDTILGLCGGMCYAALDYYYAGWRVPSGGVVPDVGSDLHGYLMRRQIDSLLRPLVPLKIMEWMLRDDDDVAGLTLRREMPKVRRRLNKMNPAVLLLIRGGGMVDPTQNHQVIAVGCDIHPVTEVITLELYDPNYPGERPTITIDPGPRVGGSLISGNISLSQSTGEPLRGFFVQSYRSRKRGLPSLA